MLYYALMFLVVGLIAGILGSSSISFAGGLPGRSDVGPATSGSPEVADLVRSRPRVRKD
jgi:hypothetical protein